MLMKLNPLAKLIIFVLSIMSTLPPAVSTSSPDAKTGCQSQCGNVTIPYPFGIGSADCFYNEWFQIICKDDERPYIHINPDGVESYEVVDIYARSFITMVKIRSSISVTRFCDDTSDWLGANLTGGPFYYYQTTKFMLVGCGTAVFSISNQIPKRGCASVCDDRRGIGRCRGINCCQDTSFVTYYPRMTQYKFNFSNSLAGKNNCASAIMVDEQWTPENASLFTDPSAVLVDLDVPLNLGWRIPNSMPGPGFGGNRYCQLVDDEYWYCRCPCGGLLEANPYILDGCQGYFWRNCEKPFVQKYLKSIVVGGIGLLISVLATTSYLVYKIIRRRVEKRLKEKKFKQNGGLLLTNHLSSNIGIMEKVRLFTSKDLNKATDHFNENRVIGRGGQATVYKGMLADGNIVAIKKSKVVVGANQVDEFINEIIVLSQIDHRNVVKLFGCCLEMDDPLLVYEFIPNGTLYNLVHNENRVFPLSWEVRLRVAQEVAEALAYLHSATSIPVYHRDIKSSNILLDDKYRAKVADFGTSRNIGIDQTHITTLVKGTFGYLDPEYFQSSQFNDKSDVYSFGVVLVELLTGLKPIYFSEEEQIHLNLATQFRLSMKEHHVDKIIDPQVKETSSEEELKSILRLSELCLNVNGGNRPSMKEVAMELQSIKKSQILSTVLVSSYEKEVQLSDIVTSSHLATSSLNDSPFSCSSSV